MSVSSWRPVTAVAIALLVGAVAVAFALRNDEGAVLAVPVVLVALGSALVAGVLAAMVRRETRLDDLSVPDRFRSQVARAPGLHAPSWWGPAAAAAACVAVTGAYVSTLIAGIGLGLLGAFLAVGAVELDRGRRARVVVPGEEESPPLDRDAVRLARRVLAFGRERSTADDATVDAVLEGVGRYGVKVVLVGADGRVGDLVVRDLPRARLACDLAGARVHETFSRDLTARMHNTRYEWQRMGVGSPGPLRPSRRRDEVQRREATQQPGTEREIATGDVQPSAR